MLIRDVWHVEKEALHSRKQVPGQAIAGEQQICDVTRGKGGAHSRSVVYEGVIAEHACGRLIRHII